MNRRDVLKHGAAASLGALLPLFPARRTSPAPVAPLSRRVRNVVFLVYDGTGYEDLAAATHFSQRVLGRPLRMQELLSRGAAGSMMTHSLTSVVTDSAAASTAWATGRKVVNQAVSQYPDGTRLTTVLELARDRGLATGLVTTTRVTHATPAAWVAHVPHRDLEDEIAAQYLSFAPDVLLGGGAAHFDPAQREDGRDLFGAFRRRGYDVLRTRAELLASNGSRLLGTFSRGTAHLPFEIDRRYQGMDAPSLAEMTRRALDVLAGADRGFVLQVEAGRIDHANHHNDPGGMIWDWMAADEALDAVLGFVGSRDDTLLIFAPDHDTGAGGVYGLGPGYRRSTEAFEALANRRASHERTLAVLREARDADGVRAAVAEMLGIVPTDAQTDALLRLLHEGERAGHATAHSGSLNSLSFILSEMPRGTPDRPNLAFGTGNHTAGVVPVALLGAGVTPRNLGLVDNTDLFRWMTDALGIDHRNPELSEEEARETAAAG